MARQPIEIDRDKLRAAVRKLKNEYIFYMLNDAIDLLPPAKLHKIARKYLDLKSLRPDREKATERSLLADAKAFKKASLAGQYYESFDVNSKNYTEQSTRTSAWIVECRRLLDRCVVEEKKSVATQVRQAFDIIFGLLDHIDECLDDVVFFADEAGAWQVGVDWDKVLPPWFRVLAATALPSEYAEQITALLERHYAHGRDKILVVARKAATPAQRRALCEIATRRARRWRRAKMP